MIKSEVLRRKKDEVMVRNRRQEKEAALEWFCVDGRG
jgi:hypothetical protein